MKYWKRKANHWYLSVNKNKSRKIERKIVDNFKKSKNGVVDYRAGTGSKWNSSTRRLPYVTENKCFGSGSARIRIKICLLDPDPHGQMLIRIQEVKKPRKYTDSLGE